MRNGIIFFLIVIAYKSSGQFSKGFNYEPYFSAIIVRNIDTSVSWYQSVFNMAIKSRMDDTSSNNRVVILESPSFLLELLQLNGSLIPEKLFENKPQGTRIQGHFKIGFKTNEIDKCLNHLASLQIRILHIWTDPITKKRNFLITDPDGNLLQFFEPTAQTLPATPGLRAHHALVYDEMNKYIILSAGSTPLNGGSSFEIYNDLWSFDGAKWVSLEASSGDKRSSIRLAYDTKRKKVFSFGGYSPDSSFCDLRVLENGQWNTLSYLPSMRAAEHGFVYDIDRDKLIVFGGSSRRGQVNTDTWEWNGIEWKKFNGMGPPGRQAFAMIYDNKRKKTILYGGFGVTPDNRFEDTWEYDGNTWSLINEKGPGPLHGMGFTYDSKRGQLLLFGGMTQNGRSGITWAFNGKTWNKLSDQGPPARAMCYMAYDKIRDRVIMFGGRLTWPHDVNDTWEWNGKEWKEIKQ